MLVLRHLSGLIARNDLIAIESQPKLSFAWHQIDGDGQIASAIMREFIGNRPSRQSLIQRCCSEAQHNPDYDHSGNNVATRSVLHPTFTTNKKMTHAIAAVAISGTTAARPHNAWGSRRM